MNRLLLVLLTLMVANYLQAFSVTFRLQMVGVSGYTTPEVNGTFNGWCGSCNPMNDTNNDGIWETTIDLPSGYFEYKFSSDNWSQQESLSAGSSCTATTGEFTNRTLQVTGNTVLSTVCWGLCSSCSTSNVTFAVDMSSVNGFTTPYVSGTFNDWCGNCNAMSDPDDDGVWTATIALQSGYYEYKYSYNNWQGSESLPVGASCTTTNFGFTNRIITVSQNIVLSPVCWGTCDTPGNGEGPAATVQIAQTSGTNPSCILSDISFAATTTNTSSTPTFQWFVDGVPVGLNQNTYSTHQITNGQTVSCSITGGTGCGSNATVSSNTIVVQRENPTTPTISINAVNGESWCVGQPITFNAAITNGGSNPSYQWRVNGSNVGTNSPSYTANSLQSGQSIQCILTSNSTCQQAPLNLLWSDEFNGTALDLTKWTPETGASGWGNNEWQNYTNTSNNIQFNNGQLHIVARNDGPQGLQYSSARLITKNNFSFKYGRVSGRLQIPTGQGIWPAFWMLGANIDQVSWPTSGEIDIMEHVNNDAQIHGTTHWNNNGWTSNSGHIDTSVGGFHEYMVDWDSLAIRFYMDNQLYHTHNITSTNGSLDEFTKPFFLLLNVAVGGNWPGYPDGSTTFPVRMDVDYVRVWQRTAAIGNNYSSNNITLTSSNSQLWYIDNDNDGYGSSLSIQNGCLQPVGYVANDGDCNDDNNSIHPGIPELCNGLDDNCNNAVDENFDDTDLDNIADCIDPDIDGDGSMNNMDCLPYNVNAWQTATVYIDQDGDGYGAGSAQSLCIGNAPPIGYALLADDCDDTNDTVYPGSTAAPAVISGPTDICGGQTFAFETLIGAQNYSWTLPANASGTSISNTLTLQFAPAFMGGDLCVTPQYSCASAPTVCTSLTAISGVAPYPGTITGVVLVCTDNSPYTYSIAPLNNVDDYIWTIPSNCTLISGQGTTEITVQYNNIFTTGNLQLQTENCTGLSLVRTLKVNKQNLPRRPGAMTGPSIVCPGSTHTYEVPPASGATSHQWSASPGITILSGEGTTTVTVAFDNNFVGGGLNVVGSNCTGIGQSRYRAINRQPLPATPGLITGPTVGVCGPQTSTYSIAAMSNVTGYEWQVPANATIVSGQGTTTVTVSFNANYNTGTLSVRGVNCSGQSATPRNLLIKVSIGIPTVIQGQTTAVCSGTTQTYQTNPVLGATHYIWTVPAGATINGAVNGPSISLTFPTPFVSGSVSVRAATDCYISFPQSISVSSTLSLPSNISGSATGLCGGCNYTYSISAMLGANNYNWTLPLGWTMLNNDGTSINVEVPSAGFTTATIMVSAQNQCGNSPIRILNVSGDLASAMPSEITESPTTLPAWPLYKQASSIAIPTSYPNPTTGLLYLVLDATSEEVRSIRVTDATGREVDVLMIEDEVNHQKHTLQLEALPAGIYFIHFPIDGRHQSIRVVKQ